MDLIEDFEYAVKLDDEVNKLISTVVDFTDLENYNKIDVDL